MRNPQNRRQAWWDVARSPGNGYEASEGNLRLAFNGRLATIESMLESVELAVTMLMVSKSAKWKRIQTKRIPSETGGGVSKTQNDPGAPSK
eukprot:4943509-Amphidinium_carterae.1